MDVTVKPGLEPGAHGAELQGHRQAWQVRGRGGAVCLAHPGGPGAAWDYLRAPLLEERLRMVYLEPVGTGGSARLDGPGAYSIDTYVASVAGLIDLLQEPVWFLGHSHGGFVGLELALAAPELLRGLILFDSAPATGPDFWAAAEEGVAAFADRHQENPELPDVLQALAEEGQATTDAGATDNFRRHFPVYFADYWGREDEFREMREGASMHVLAPESVASEPFDVRARLGEIAVSTLIIVGRHDPICGPGWAGVLHEGIRDSELVVLENSGHMGHVEEAEAFAAAIRGFVGA
jgi:proline iminopeptidase